MNDKSDDVTARLREGFESNAPELSPELVAGASARTAPRLPNIRRRRQVAGGAVAALAAVTVGSLVVTTPFERDPLFVAGGQGGNSTAAAATESMDAARLMIYRQYEYSAGPGLSKDGGSGSVYQLRQVGSPQERVAEIARVFDLDGEVEKPDYFDPKHPSYVVGSQDGTGPSVTVTWTGTADWWYNNPSAEYTYACAFVSDEDSEERIAEEQKCADDFAKAAEEAPNLAPSEAEASKLAAELFGKTGLEVSPDDVTVNADNWQTTATANLEVDGVETSLAWNVSWDKSGEITWASGPSVEVVERGEFGTISAFDAVKRLDDYRWFGAADPKYQGGFHTLAAENGVARMEAGVADSGPGLPSDPNDVAVEAPAPDEPGTIEVEELPGNEEPSTGGGQDGEPGTGVEPAPAPSEEPVEPAEPGVVATPEPMPVDPTDPVEPPIEPMPEPEVVKVTIEKAEATLLLMWDSEGNAWLVPGFAMEQPEGMWGTVVSLEEGVIELPEPIEFEPMLEQDVMTR